MANTQAMCNSFKTEILQAYHNFYATNAARTINTADVFKGALYYASGSLGAGTTVYSTTSEVTSSTGTPPGSGYGAGGLTITQTNPALVSNSAQWTPSAPLVWTSVTIVAFDALLVYNSSQGNRAVSVHNFGSQTINNGTFSLTMPASGGLISIT